MHLHVMGDYDTHRAPSTQSQNVRASNTNEQSRGSYRVFRTIITFRQYRFAKTRTFSRRRRVYRVLVTTEQNQHADARCRYLVR